MINFASPVDSNAELKQEILDSVEAVLNSGNYILGDQVSKFEENFSKYLGVNQVIGCGNGTDALFLAMRALDIGSGDEVIVPAHTATATVAAVKMVGATPVYVDIDPLYYTISPELVAAACSERTKAIIAVHLYGQSADMQSLKALADIRGIFLVEDCAQSTGGKWGDKRLGAIGDVGCFSFFPTKNLGAVGDGGAVVCNDERLGSRVRALAQYGWDSRRVSNEAGVNSRLDEIQAAILNCKLPYLDAANKIRMDKARYYSERLASSAAITPSERRVGEHVYHLYPVLIRDRDRVIRDLKLSGINLGVHYRSLPCEMPAYFSASEFFEAKRVCDNTVSLPLYPEISEVDQEKVISEFLSAIDGA